MAPPRFTGGSPRASVRPPFRRPPVPWPARWNRPHFRLAINPVIAVDSLLLFDDCAAQRRLGASAGSGPRRAQCSPANCRTRPGARPRSAPRPRPEKPDHAQQADVDLVRLDRRRVFGRQVRRSSLGILEVQRFGQRGSCTGTSGARPGATPCGQGQPPSPTTSASTMPTAAAARAVDQRMNAWCSPATW